MSKFEQYNIRLKEIVNGTQVFEFDLNEEYFAKINSPEVKKGNVSAKVSVRKKIATYELAFQLEGIIKVPCNRCLDDMEQFIKHEEKIEVKFGNNYAEENEIVIVPESEGCINIAWFLYEFIILNIPIKHVHPPGECNKSMIDKLRRHVARQKDDSDDNELFDDMSDDDSIEEDMQIDPRWESLQNINFDNN